VCLSSTRSDSSSYDMAMNRRFLFDYVLFYLLRAHLVADPSTEGDLTCRKMVHLSSLAYIALHTANLTSHLYQSFVDRFSMAIFQPLMDSWKIVFVFIAVSDEENGNTSCLDLLCYSACRRAEEVYVFVFVFLAIEEASATIGPFVNLY
jgi:hypothetical protein